MGVHYYPTFDISIHAPRVGSDWELDRYPMGKGISIHAPRVGSDDGVIGPNKYGNH